MDLLSLAYAIDLRSRMKVSSKDWSCRFILAAFLASAVADALSVETTVIDLTGAQPVEFRPELFGFNCEIMLEVAFKDMTFDGEVMREVVGDLKPRALRFPGGSTANNYLWREDGYSLATGDITGWAAAHIEMFRSEGKPLGLKSFIDLCKNFDVTPVYVFNVFEDSAEGLCAFVEKVESMGGRVPFIEFANEPYWDPRALDNVEAYLEKTRPMGRALKAFRPETRIGVCLAPFGNPANYEKNWNTPVMADPAFDAVIFHEYHGRQGLAMEPSEAMSLDAFLHPETALDEMLDQLDATAPGIPIWLTEYNIGFKHLDAHAYTAAHGLYLASVFAWLSEHGDRFELAHFHQLYQVGFGTFFVEEESRETRLTASYFMWRLLGRVSAGADRAYAIESGSHDLKVTGFEGSGPRRVLVVNKSGSERSLNLRIEGGPLDLEWSLAYIAYEDLEDKVPYDFDLTRNSRGQGPDIVVPAWSVSAIRIGPDPNWSD